MFTKAFLLPALERAVKTFVQTLIAVATVDGVFDLAQINWATALTAAGSATVLSLLTSILSAAAGPKGSPSLVTDPAAAEPPNPAGRR